MTEEMERRVKRLEGLLYGPEDEPEKSLIHRLMVTEGIVAEIRELHRRIQWLIIAGVLVGLLNLLIKTDFRLPMPSASSATSKS